MAKKPNFLDSLEDAMYDGEKPKSVVEENQKKGKNPLAFLNDLEAALDNKKPLSEDAKKLANIMVEPSQQQKKPQQRQQSSYQEEQYEAVQYSEKDDLYEQKLLDLYNRKKNPTSFQSSQKTNINEQKQIILEVLKTDKQLQKAIFNVLIKDNMDYLETVIQESVSVLFEDYEKLKKEHNTMKKIIAKLIK